jgi:hypothetical protein
MLEASGRQNDGRGDECHYSHCWPPRKEAVAPKPQEAQGKPEVDTDEPRKEERGNLALDRMALMV